MPAILRDLKEKYICLMTVATEKLKHLVVE